MKKKKINIKKIVICLIVFAVLFFVGYKLGKLNNVNYEVNNTDNQSNEINEVVEITGDVQKPNNVIDIDIDGEKLIYSVAVLGSFEDGKKLSTEQYLQVIYNAISNKYIDLGDKIENNKISEQVVNSLVYKIFGLELEQNMSINGLEYADHFYKINPKRSGYIFLIQNQSTDSAAGTAYKSFDLYKEFASGEEKYIGKYTISIVKNTVTGESYIKSFCKD